MDGTGGIGRVAVRDGGARGRRVLRAVRELARAGRAAETVAVIAPNEREAPFAREADEVVVLDGPPERALELARPGAAWLGDASLAERAAFAAACAARGVVHLGWPAEALARVSTPGWLAERAAELGIERAGAAPDPRSRLIEVVVARDGVGDSRALGTADASLRRGPAVVLSESPAPGLDAEQVVAACDVAVKVATAAGAVGVIAVSLLVHPTTGALALVDLGPLPAAGCALEAAIGVDLVRLSLHLATGGPVPAAALLGAHAMAARLDARDPEDRTAVPGRVALLRLPCDPDVRADAAVEVGDPAPAGNAPVATIVARGPDRDAALRRLAQALAEADVLVRGTGTSRALLLALLDRPELRGGIAGVGLLPRLAATGEPLVVPRPGHALLAAAIEAYEADLDLERARFLAGARRGRPRVGPSTGRPVDLRLAGRRHRLEVRQVGPDRFRVASGVGSVDVRVERLGPSERQLDVNGTRMRVLSAAEGARVLVDVEGTPHVVEREPAGLVTSPLPAVVLSVPVEPGQRVARGDEVARLESMKVEAVVTAPEDGVVREVLTLPNAQVDAGAPLLRIDPAGEAYAELAPPLAFEPTAPQPPQDARAAYLAALGELRALLLGFDFVPAEAARITAALVERAAAVPAADPAALRAEEDALAAFADVLVLFRRVPEPARGAGERPRPALEELWRYLHEPGARGAGLSPAFVARLRTALRHYGVSLDAPGRALELALLRLQKAHERASASVPAIRAILERRLDSGDEPLGFEGEGARALLDRLVDVGQERAPALADLARDLRFRRFDRPEFERLRAAVYAQAEADLAAVSRPCAGREAALARLVACPQPLATLLVARMAAADAAIRPALVEILLRRYYRTVPLAGVSPRELDGFACATAEHDVDGRRERLVAGFARAADAPRLARALARYAAEVPAGMDLTIEAYLWADDPSGPPEVLAARLGDALEGAGFPRPLRRASFVVARAGRGLGRQASQQHLSFRGGPDRFEEEPRYRGVHPLLFRRMQLSRLSRFELERLPSVEDVFLYRGVARENPKDERLFAVAEVRDLTPVRDADGQIVQLPHLERKLHEALAGMRRFQASRDPQQRLHWNRVLLTLEPPLVLPKEALHRVAARLAPATEGLGLEMVLLAARIPDPLTGALADTFVRVTLAGEGLAIRYDPPTDRPLEPMQEYQRRVIALRRRGLTHPFEIVRMLAPPRGALADVPPGEFAEHDLDAGGALVPVRRPPGENTANVVVGVMRTFTDRYPEGMLRVVLLGDPTRAMGSLAEPECRRVIAAIDLAERLGVPLEWFAVSAGAKISMESGTENMDWISRVLRRIVEHTARGGEINVVVTGVNVGAQPYWNAEATMLMHTRGILVMTPGSAMVLTGKEALEYSGSVAAEDNLLIGGYDRIMGPNGQAQYQAASLADAIRILLAHYDHTYVAPGERFPRRARTEDPPERDVRASPHGPEGGAGFTTVGDVFSAEKNPDRKKPFDIRRILAAAIDQDLPPLERWRDVRGGETAVVWDAHLGGWPVCLLGIESRPLPRLEFVPADGPELWSAGTLFPQSSKKLARAINGASGNRPVVVLANLSGFDGSPESMRRLQLEYGAEIGRAVVTFDGPLVFCVVSRYHGGAFVVFSKALREEMEAVAVEGARASVIGGAPAAAVVFSREVDARTRKDPRVVAAEQAAARGGGAARARLAEVLAQVRSEKMGEVAEEFDAVHTVERARRVGSLDAIIAARDLRPWLISAVERGIARHAEREPEAAAHEQPEPPVMH
ncbi:carboxyl transferase domain-containing protein [Anaeromyxobacter oryzisoli]|uniref:carboxyl transferase domain-containing protein n=1 Tax=Anaeromyxobacter oryzisoli TaxID=2925408 RepID=UPI001F5A6B13|nr:carboxyl transferase domain-containing protein [Anaeromyxobacter sp. SG63]